MRISPNAIDQLLPQTQCKQCGFNACFPYAEALSKGESDLNRCPPGGAPVMRALAKLLNKPEKPINPECGTVKAPQIVRINESLCIGCTKCIQACPVDAIIGAKKLMHTIIAHECTGCELCIPPCPLDCIDIIPVIQNDFAEFGLTQTQQQRASQSRKRYQARLKREEERITVTNTLPPQEKVLADRVDTKNMLSFIELAKQKAKAKQTSQNINPES